MTSTATPYDATKAALDAALVAYFGAYEAHLTCRAELQAALRDGHLGLARARRDLSRTRNTATPCIGELQFPAGFEATLGVEGVEPAADADIGAPGVPLLRAARRAPSEAALDDDGGGADAAAELRRRRAPDSDALRDLQALGVRSGLASEIAASVADDRIPCPAHPAQAEPTPAAGRTLKEAQYNGLLAAAPAAAPAARDPRDPRDPILWFAALPPQPLRQAQARFRRAVDLIVELANLAARMDAARRRYEGLQAELGASSKS